MGLWERWDKTDREGQWGVLCMVLHCERAVSLHRGALGDLTLHLKKGTLAP